MASLYFLTNHSQQNRIKTKANPLRLKEPYSCSTKVIISCFSSLHFLTSAIRAWQIGTLPSVFIFRAVLTKANKVALNMTVPSLFSGIFMATNLCEGEKNTLFEKKEKIPSVTLTSEKVTESNNTTERHNIMELFKKHWAFHPSCLW